MGEGVGVGVGVGDCVGVDVDVDGGAEAVGCVGAVVEDVLVVVVLVAPLPSLPGSPQAVKMAKLKMIKRYNACFMVYPSFLFMPTGHARRQNLKSSPYTAKLYQRDLSALCVHLLKSYVGLAGTT